MRSTVPEHRPDPASLRAPRLARVRRAAAVAVIAMTGSLLTATAPAQAAVVTPGDFTGYGFDQCVAPTQRAMDAWLNSSPFLAVGIYISGDSRACINQPNLSPTWVRTQLANGWRLLPIALGPQASCTTRERYLRQVRISAQPADAYAGARSQGRAEAAEAVAVASRLGISRGSTLWYDLEAFPIGSIGCRESALSFLSAWTRRLHGLGYVSGVYSSAASGIKVLDDARATRPGAYTMPDQVWIADWNGRADTRSSYVRSDGWQPHARVHQYRGGHDEVHGGVRINIDSNWLDVGRGSWTPRERAHCGGAAAYNFDRYATLAVGARGAQVRTLQCMLRGQKAYDGAVDGVYDAGLGAAVRAYRVARGLSAGTSTTQATWLALVTRGATPVLKRGSAGSAVRRVQRGLNVADGASLTVTGIFDAATTAAVRTYQGGHRLSRTGVVAPATWRLLQRGVR